MNVEPLFPQMHDDTGDDLGRGPQDLLVVDVEGFEGPLDLLLSLAREQKVDLTRISILSLAEQYLVYVEAARLKHLEIAADYLVMAAWLAYLKSRLLLPEDEGDDEPSSDELAAALAFRLRRLEAMREAASRLMNRNRLGQQVFARGAPQATVTNRQNQFIASLYDLLEAYASQRQRQFVQFVTIVKRSVFSLKEARTLLIRMIGERFDWAPIDSYLIEYLSTPETRATARASSLSAGLELVREGHIEIRQTSAFSPLYVRRKPAKQSTGPESNA
jgi:segregation and condensation protein A